jgi:hypothetical protein
MTQINAKNLKTSQEQRGFAHGQDLLQPASFKKAILITKMPSVATKSIIFFNIAFLASISCTEITSNNDTIF